MTSTLDVSTEESLRPSNGSLASWLQRLNVRLRKITQPADALTDPEDRRKARLLAYMSLSLAVILTIAGIVSTFTSIFFPDPAISLGVPGTVLVFLTAAGFWVSYRYSITARYRFAAWTTISIIYFFLTGFMFFYRSIGFGLPLGFAVPVLLATIFLTSSGTIRVFGLSVFFSLVTLLSQNVAVVLFAVVFAILLVVTVLTVIVALLREEDLAQVKRLRELEAAEGERLRRELELARKVQLAMLPTELPVTLHLDLAAYSQPAFEASGDFYDVFFIDNDKIGIVVCDVAGKGVSSALIMSATRAALRAEAERNDSPAKVLAKVNSVLAKSIPTGLFVTLFYGIHNPATNELCFASAGHPHPYWWNGTTIGELQSYGMPLGLAEESEYMDQMVKLKVGDSIFVYTDGLVEALNSRREMFGFDTVQNHVAQNASEQIKADEMIQRTLHAMEVFVDGERQQDDITIVVLKVRDRLQAAANVPVA
jgi:serine phosphatase RsbU (regulator of sigma subunit)